MKTILITLTALLFGLAAELRADSITEKGKQQLEWLKAGQADSLRAHFDKTMTDAMPTFALQQLWQQLTAQVGALKSEGEWKSGLIGGVEAATCELTFEKAGLTFVAAFDNAGKVCGLQFLPSQQQKAEPAKKTPARELRSTDAFEEKAFTVENGDVKLPGILTMPKNAAAPVAAVVLVHGSGPCDMDESLGPNKPFRDIADALAAKGIAVLRYEKRTKTYAMNQEVLNPETLTPDTECTDDAVQAVGQLAQTAGIDASRIFVCGHSLGGMLAPRIAEKSGGKVAGLICLAAPARNIFKVMRDQIEYVETLQGRSEDDAFDKAEKLVEQVKASQPEQYVKFFDSYDFLGTARKLANMPMLFIQGGNDYQVTQDDFFTWTSAIDGNDNAKFVFLEKADHLMRELDHKAVPADYEAEGHVCAEALQSMADFILSKH